MKDNLKDILSNLSKQLDQDLLLKYLSGQLSEEQKHEVERSLMANDFDNDALEGLQQLSNKENIPFIVEQINRDMRKKLERKRRRRRKMQFRDQPYVYVAILIILILVVLSYFVIQRLAESNP